MEMTEQHQSDLFSQMLHMFPNIPQDIIWLYVQQYSSDIEMCTRMLHMQNNKHAGTESALNDSRNLNESNSFFQTPSAMPITITYNNNDDDDVPLSNELFTESSNNVIKNANQEARNLTFKPLFINSQFEASSRSDQDLTPVDSSKNTADVVRFYEPLSLDITPDDEGISHSWRPNMSDDFLCPNFLSSITGKNVQSSSNEASNLNLNDGSEGDRYTYSPERQEFMVYYNYSANVRPTYNEDISRYLHMQKSQMNALWYEVIKTKIEVGDRKESVARLDSELKEKMESKSAEEIEELNKEIVQLRLECQSLCSEVDHLLNNEAVLGEVDEKCYEKIEASPNKADTQSISSHQCTNSHCESHAVSASDESTTWECSKCTFLNHSAINVCEMCNVPKQGTRLPPFVNTGSSSCYCHPKEKSLSIQS